MVPIFFVEKVNLVVEHLHTYKNCSLVLSATTECLHLSGLRIFLVDMLVIIPISSIYFIEEEWQQN